MMDIMNIQSKFKNNGLAKPRVTTINLNRFYEIESKT